MTDDPNRPDLDYPGGTVRPDARSLRGIAHPLRVRLLGLLRAEGPSTATRLAQRLGLNSGATSYHLRQLATYGFVVEDTGRGAGRERWWRAAHRFTEFRSADIGAEDPELANAYLHAVAMRHAEKMHDAVDEWLTLPEEWQRVGTLSDRQLRLTAEECARLLAELREVLGRYRLDDPERADDAPVGSALVEVQLQVFHRPGAPAPKGEA
jgi:predicted ArsR family transcriptional regulator